MLPVEVYCQNCGGFVGMEMTDGRPAASGKHEYLTNCIKVLNDRIAEIENYQSTQEQGAA